MISNFHCVAIFADDIRHEINGKISLMGIYRETMYVPVFPITIQKICSYFELRIPPKQYSNMDAVITVMKDSEIINSITLNMPTYEDEKIADHGKPFAFKYAAGALELPSMTFSDSTLLEITAQFDGQMEIAGRLWVTTFPQENDKNLYE